MNIVEPKGTDNNKTLELGDLVVLVVYDSELLQESYFVSRTHGDKYMLINPTTGYYANGTYDTLKDLTDIVNGYVQNNEAKIYRKSEFDLKLALKQEDN